MTDAPAAAADELLAELDELLERSPSDLEQPTLALRERILERGTPLVLYGPGTTGRAVLEMARAAGVEPVCFAVDGPGGGEVDGVRVVPLGEVREHAGSECVVAVTILQAALPVLAAIERVVTIAGAPRSNVVTAFALAHAIGSDSADERPLTFPAPPRFTIGHGAEVRDAAALFAHDEESLRQFVAHVRFRTTGDHAALPEPARPQYFPAEIVQALRRAPFRFLDGGALDGDTLRDLLDVVPQDHLVEAIEFEPATRSRASLASFVDTLDPALRARVRIHEAALGAEAGWLRFVDSGDAAARLDDHGTVNVDVVAVDDVLQERPDSSLRTYLKLDVEGGEHAALVGAQHVLEQPDSLLAVSVYHRPADLWELPRLLASRRHDRHLLLRTHGHDGTDLVAYGLPGD